MLTFRTLCSGGELFGVGARAAGWRHMDGYEIDPQIAAVACLNGFDVRVADVCAVDYEALAPVDHLHASPSCKSASQANTNGGETPGDLAVADAICMAIAWHQGRTFSLENVWGYRKYESFRRILATLAACGYAVDYRHINAADYGGWQECPLHAVKPAAPFSARGIAPEFVEIVAMMRPAAQARFLAWDVVANLVRATHQDTAVSAIWREWESADKKGLPILLGGAESVLMNVDTSACDLTTNMNGSIESLLRGCLDEHSLKTRWFTTSTAIRRITLLKIYRCLLATASTQHSTMPNDARESCPLCKYTAVPQTRKRLILRAVRGAPVPPLHPTHRKGGDMFHQPWVGWYAAIEDLLDTLPETTPAPWQLARLPKELRETLLFANNDSQDQRGNSYGATSRAAGDPALTISTMSAGWWKAYLVGDQSAGAGVGDLNADASAPAFTLRASDHNAPARAYLIGGGNTQLAQVDSHARPADEPAFTVRDGANGSPERAFLLSNQSHHTDRDLQIYDAQAPAPTMLTFGPDGGVAHRAYVGRWVRLTIQSLGRLQTVPDSYIGLTPTVNGNGVPCLLAQRIMESLRGIYEQP